MKNLKTTYFVPFLMGFALFFSCKSTKVHADFPYKFLESTYYRWSGGQPGVKGTNVVLKVLNTNAIGFKADSIYFKNKAVKVETHIKKDTLIFMGYFTDYKAPIDIELTPQTKKQIPLVALQNPYHLSDKEAVLTYFINSKKLFVKISNLVETDNQYYP